MIGHYFKEASDEHRRRSDIAQTLSEYVAHPIEGHQA
jgi:hypothetical protein